MRGIKQLILARVKKKQTVKLWTAACAGTLSGVSTGDFEHKIDEDKDKTLQSFIRGS